MSTQSITSAQTALVPYLMTPSFKALIRKDKKSVALVSAKSRTRLSDFAFTFHFHALEKEMATHSSVLAWRIPRTGDPGGLLSIIL